MQKYYAVRVGRRPGIYLDWQTCKAEIDGFSGAVYKSFPTRQEAEAFFRGEALNGQAAAGNAAASCSGAFTADGDGCLMEAYVDGSYLAETGEYSYGCVILTGGEEIELSRKVTEAPELASMRNVAGEIKGAEAAMRYALEHGADSLVIYHDYAGIAHWCTGEWKANLEGTRAYRDYYRSICGRLQVSFVKVRGHSGVRCNEKADRLAKAALGIEPKQKTAKGTAEENNG